MAAIYGHRWVTAFGETPENGAGRLTIAGDTWKRGLAGLAERQIGAGLQACVASNEPWPPTLPEFRAMCLGVPALAAVRMELASRSAERSAFAVLVWRFVDGHRYRLADGDRADRILREAYDLAREYLMRGGTLPEPATALEAPEEQQRSPATEQTVRESLDRIARTLEQPPDEDGQR